VSKDDSSPPLPPAIIISVSTVLLLWSKKRLKFCI